MAGRYCEGKIKMASEKVSHKMVLEIKYVNASNAVIHTKNSTKLLLDSKINLGTRIWAKFRLGTGIWYPLHDPLTMKYRYFRISPDCLRARSFGINPE